jgi:tRNA pseudouridine32 synthase / 23S rRNA pseudouridine746 synthase
MLDVNVFTRDGVDASRVVCPAGQWQTALQFLCQRFPFIDAQIWRTRFINHRVLDDQGQPLSIDAPHCVGATLYYFREIAQEKPLPCQETILYQDDCIVVADKPHFLPVHPSGQYVQETLLVRLKRRLNLPELSPLHRIDRDTAGVVLFSVQAKQRDAYQKLFRDGQMHKQYQALAPYDTLLAAQAPLHIRNRLDTASNFMQMHAVPGEPNAHTELLSVTRLSSLCPLESLPPLGFIECLDEAQPQNVGLYTLRPHTGKRHQLRVHMLGLGVPIMGDGIYPTLLPERDISQAVHAPMQLLAQSMAFTDPITGQQRYFESQRTLKTA